MQIPVRCPAIPAPPHGEQLLARHVFHRLAHRLRVWNCRGLGFVQTKEIAPSIAPRVGNRGRVLAPIGHKVHTERSTRNPIFDREPGDFIPPKRDLYLRVFGPRELLIVEREPDLILVYERIAQLGHRILRPIRAAVRRNILGIIAQLLGRGGPHLHRVIHFGRDGQIANLDDEWLAWQPARGIGCHLEWFRRFGARLIRERLRAQRGVRVRNLAQAAR